MGTKILQPDVNFGVTSAPHAVDNAAQRALIVAQMTSAGSATSGALYQDIGNAGQEAALFGARSHAAASVRAFKAIAPEVALDVIPLDDSGSAVARAVTMTFSGTATEDGSYVISCGGQYNYSTTVSVSSGDTAATVASAVDDACDLLTNAPFTTDESSAVVTFTAANGGTVANGLGIDCYGSVAGLTVAVAEDTAGANDPTLTGVLDVVANIRYQGIVWAFSNSTSVLVASLVAKGFAKTNEILDGVGFVVDVDSLADHTTALGSLNEKHLVYFAQKEESETAYVGPSYNEPSYELAAMVAAVRAKRLTEDAALGLYVTTRAALDQFGGTELASLPYFNTRLPQVNVARTGRGWTNTEIESLKALGGSVVGEDRTSSNVVLGEVVSTYLTDSGGNPDVTFTFLNYMDTISAVREYFHNNNRSRFAQSRLTSGTQLVAGRDVVNEAVFRGYQNRLYLDCEQLQLVEPGQAARDFFANNLTYTPTLSEGKITTTYRVPIVVQFRTLIATLQIVFDTSN